MARKVTSSKKTTPKKPASTDTIQLTRIVDAIIDIPIVGLTAVIPHRWSEKARAMMPGHPSGDQVKEKKGKHDPQAEAEACLYKLDKSLALPATAFKAAITGACRFFDAPTMVEAKQLLFVEGNGAEQLIPITGTKELREDLPRNANGNPDLRYRYYINDWKTRLRVRYVPARISRESVIALVDAAGRGGIGDWRPSSPKSYTGTYGTFRVDLTQEVRDVTA